LWPSTAAEGRNHIAVSRAAFRPTSTRAGGNVVREEIFMHCAGPLEQLLPINLALGSVTAVQRFVVLQKEQSDHTLT